MGKTAGVIETKVEAKAGGSVAVVTYIMASLSEEDEKVPAAMMVEAFASNMACWQVAIAKQHEPIDRWLASKNEPGQQQNLRRPDLL